MVVAEDESWFVVGCYLPPSDKWGEAQQLATAALEGGAAGSPSLIIGNLNSNLDFPRDRQKEILSTTVRERGMRCASRCFCTRRTRRTRGRWTWRQRRGIPGSDQTQWLRSKLDYFLFREKDQRRRWTRPRHHDSDHRAPSSTSGHSRGRYPTTWRDGSGCPCSRPCRRSRPGGGTFLLSCQPLWRRCRGGSARATSGSAMAHDGSWTNAAPCASRVGCQFSRAGAWGDASARRSRVAATIAPSRLATSPWPT